MAYKHIFIEEDLNMKKKREKKKKKKTIMQSGQAPGR